MYRLNHYILGILTKMGFPLDCLFYHYSLK